MPVPRIPRRSFLRMRRPYISSAVRAFDVGLRKRQGEIHGRALADLAVSPDLAAVAPHDAIHRGEPDPGALELFRRVQSLERSEQLVRIAHVETGAVVAHEERGSLAALVATDLDTGCVALARELPGVRQ